MPRQDPQQFREQALSLVEKVLPEHETESAAMTKVASKLGVSTEAIRCSKRQGDEVNSRQQGSRCEVVPVVSPRPPEAWVDAARRQKPRNRLPCKRNMRLTSHVLRNSGALVGCESTRLRPGDGS